MYDPLTPIIANEIQSEFLKRAENERLHKLVKAAEPGLWVNLTLWLGRTLVAIGMKLQRRYGPVELAGDEAIHSPSVVGLQNGVP